jgi:hypothetical protein
MAIASHPTAATLPVRWRTRSPAPSFPTQRTEARATDITLPPDLRGLAVPAADGGPVLAADRCLSHAIGDNPRRRPARHWPRCGSASLDQACCCTRTRDAQFTSDDRQPFLKTHRTMPNMNHRRNCQGNTVAGIFFSALKRSGSRADPPNTTGSGSGRVRLHRDVLQPNSAAGSISGLSPVERTAPRAKRLVRARGTRPAAYRLILRILHAPC